MFTIRLFNLLLAASVMITACAPSGAPTPSLPIASSAPTVIALPVPMRNIASGVWSEGLPPNGIWQATLTPEDYVERGVLRETAEEEWAGVYTWTFHDGKAQLDFEGPIKTGTYTCLGEYAAVGEVVSFTFTTSVPHGTCDGAIDEAQWRLDEAGLHFHLVATSDGPLLEIQTMYEAKPLQKIADL